LIVLLLTRETGQEIRAADGAVVGRLHDITARLDAEHPAVHRLAVGSRRGLTYLLPWDVVAAFEHSAVQLGAVGSLVAFAVDRSRRLPLEHDELLLVRDVLDTQIVDVVGHRLARVSEVLLTRVADGRLEVAAVDVGIGAVCRRLGLRWPASRLPERAVDWGDLHLTSDRGHEVHLATTVSAVHRLGARDLAELLTRLDVESATEVIRAVGPERAAGAVTQVHPEVGERLMRALEPGDAAKVIDELPAAYHHRFRRELTSRGPVAHRRFSRLRGWRLHRPRDAGGPNHGGTQP
jgi:sporulation protein YlmC with PRC-barrel domain